MDMTGHSTLGELSFSALEFERTTHCTCARLARPKPWVQQLRAVASRRYFYGGVIDMQLVGLVVSHKVVLNTSRTLRLRRVVCTTCLVGCLRASQTEMR